MSHFRGVLLQIIMASLTLQLTIDPKAAVPLSEKDKISTLWEEEALVKFVLQMARTGFPIRIKSLPALAYSPYPPATPIR